MRLQGKIFMNKMSFDKSGLKREIEAVDAVSFDFFDTLFVRFLLDPEDVFDVVGKRFGIKGFRDLRRAAQTEAFRRMHLAGLKEITLASIYECFDHSSVPLDALMRAEYESELSLVHPNIELLDIYLETVTSGKRVVLTSDTYLPAEFFNEAFRQHGLPAVPLFISADRNATKRDYGELFDIIVSEMGIPHARILHIGDNAQSDVKQAKLKGLSTFYYTESRRPGKLQCVTPESSMACGLLRKHYEEIHAGSFEELGFLYGGPAAVGFLDWISGRAESDKIGRILFVARDGYVLNCIANLCTDIYLPQFDYFLGSRTAFTLAAITETNFTEFLPFLLSGSVGLSPHELLDRIGVPAPAKGVMEDLGLGDDIIVTESRFDQLSKFLYAYRWEILKVCRSNKRALHGYLKALGVQPGSRVALVDIGWNGTTQDAFELAIRDFMDIDVFGYYFCLSNTPDCKTRRQTRRMDALFSSDSGSSNLVDSIYGNRLAFELFFSAPHDSIVGLELGPAGNIIGHNDARRAYRVDQGLSATKIAKGIEVFACSYRNLLVKTRIPISPTDLAMPLIEFATEGQWRENGLVRSVKNFDCWALSANQDLLLVNQLPVWVKNAKKTSDTL